MAEALHPFASVSVPAAHVGVQWFGQSSFALKDPAGTLVQVDPYFPHARPAEKYIHPEPPLDEATLPTDYVLLTHDHSDHTCVESLQRIHAAFPACRFVGPVESVRRMREAGLPAGLLTTVTAGDTAQLGTLTAHAVWAKPPQGDPAANIDQPDVQHLGYVVEVGGVRVYISGDPIHTFARLDALIDPVARLKPDLGMLTTHPTEGEFPFFDGSVATARRIGLKTAVPSHYNCFVKRTYDPAEWAACFQPDGPPTLIIPYGGHIIYPV